MVALKHIAHTASNSFLRSIFFFANIEVSSILNSISNLFQSIMVDGEKKNYLYFWRACASSSKGECILTLQEELNDDSRDLHIEFPHTFSMRVLIRSWPNALSGSEFLIIIRPEKCSRNWFVSPEHQFRWQHIISFVQRKLVSQKLIKKLWFYF